MIKFDHQNGLVSAGVLDYKNRVSAGLFTAGELVRYATAVKFALLDKRIG